MKKIIISLCAAAVLSACGSNEVVEGQHTEVSLTNLKSKTATTDTGEGTTKQFVRAADGKQFQLETGLINVLPLELIPCTSARALPSLISSAYAHGADEASPGGVLDVSQADGTVQALGELPIAPGSYCSVRVALAPVVGAPVTAGAIDMNGSSLYVNACYYYKSGTGGDSSTHYCFPLKIAGSSAAYTVPVSQPMTFAPGGNTPQAISIAVNYDKWFDRDSEDDAFKALDGYANVVGNPPCVVTDVATYNATACTQAKNDFKAGLQSNDALKQLIVAKVLASLSASALP